MAQHTPGPWHWSEKNDWDSFHTLNPDVLEIRESHGGGQRPNEDNARLIAAAPDLFGELESMVSAAESMGPGVIEDYPAFGQLLRDRVSAARAALAKARGDTQ